MRDVDHADYMAIHKDYEESLDALTRAVEYIKVGMFVTYARTYAHARSPFSTPRLVVRTYTNGWRRTLITEAAWLL